MAKRAKPDRHEPECEIPPTENLAAGPSSLRIPDLGVKMGRLCHLTGFCDNSSRSRSSGDDVGSVRKAWSPGLVAASNNLEAVLSRENNDNSARLTLVTDR